MITLICRTTSQNSDERKESLRDLFISLRNNKDNVRLFLENYEKIASEDVPQKYSDDFCKMYVITLLSTYCRTNENKSIPTKKRDFGGPKDAKVELLLATFGWLEGYESINVNDRMMEYYKHGYGNNPLLVGIRGKKKRSAISGKQLVADASDAIANELEPILREEMEKRKGRLNLIGKVPENLSIPKLRYSTALVSDKEDSREIDEMTVDPSSTNDDKTPNSAFDSMASSETEEPEETPEPTETALNGLSESYAGNTTHSQEKDESMTKHHRDGSGGSESDPTESTPAPDNVDEGFCQILEESAPQEEGAVTDGSDCAKNHHIKISLGKSVGSDILSLSDSPDTSSPENPTSSTGESQVPVPDSFAPNPPINHQKEDSRLKKLWDRFFWGIPQKESGNSFSSLKNKNTAIGSKWDKLFKKWRERVPVSRNIGVDSIPKELWILILFVSSIVPMYMGCSMIFDRIDTSPTSSLDEIITSANPNNEVNLTREQFMVRDDDMSTIINDAREPIVLYTESGDYDVEAMRELIYERIVNNPIYGDMIIRGIMEADSFSRDQIGPHNSWMKRFLEETNVAEDKAKTYDPDMGQWLIKAGNLVSTNDDYKDYAGFLCGVLNYFDTSGGVHDFKSTCCWSIDANASGTHAHAERVDGNSVKSALVFRSGFMNGETGYLLAFSLEDGSLLFHNPWMWGVDSFLMEETPGMISAGWGDSGSGRPSYTSEEVATGALGDKIVFNSISNGYIGDEKNFIGARNETDLADNPYGYYEGNYIHVEDGKEYRVRLYVHNNNPGGERRTAENVRVGFGIPWVTARNIAVNGFLSSSNAYPDEYWDGVVLMADQNFHLEYVEGSAIFENGGFASTGNGGPKPLSDDIVTDPEGILIGYSDYDGQIPGGNEYECAVSLLVKVVFDSEDLLESKVRTLGADTWNDDVEVDVGNILEFRVRYENISYDDVIHSDVLLQAALPEGLEYMDGSAILYSKDNSKIGQIDMGTFIADGINIGNYASGEGAYILYNAKVVKGNLPDGYNKIINWASCSVNKKSIADYSTATLYKTE